jgi:hypothetical protein
MRPKLLRLSWGARRRTPRPHRGDFALGCGVPRCGCRKRDSRVAPGTDVERGHARPDYIELSPLRKVDTSPENYAARRGRGGENPHGAATQPQGEAAAVVAEQRDTRRAWLTHHRSSHSLLPAARFAGRSRRRTGPALPVRRSTPSASLTALAVPARRTARICEEAPDRLCCWQVPGLRCSETWPRGAVGEWWPPAGPRVSGMAGVSAVCRSRLGHAANHLSLPNLRCLSRSCSA